MTIHFEYKFQYNQYSLNGKCGLLLKTLIDGQGKLRYFSCVVTPPLIDDFGNFYTATVVDPGTKPECPSCLAGICAKLKNNDLTGHDYRKIRPGV